VHGRLPEGVPVVERPFFNMQGFAAPLDELVTRLRAVPLRGVAARDTTFAVPAQRYSAAPEDPTMPAWAPVRPNAFTSQLQLRSTVPDAQ